MIITLDIDGVPLCNLGGLGFEVTRTGGGKADLRLPDGWNIFDKAARATLVLDATNSHRAIIFSTIRNGTRLILLTRYAIGENWVGDTCDIVVLDRGQEAAIIHTEALELYDGDEVGFVRRKNEAVAKYFADKPDWRNPLAYWNEQ